MLDHFYLLSTPCIFRMQLTIYWLQQVVLLLLQSIYLRLPSADTSKTVVPESLGVMVFTSVNSLDQVKIILNHSILLDRSPDIKPQHSAR